MKRDWTSEYIFLPNKEQEEPNSMFQQIPIQEGVVYIFVGVIEEIH